MSGAHFLGFELLRPGLALLLLGAPIALLLGVLALGARRRDVLVSTVGQAVRLAVPGLGAGLVLALVLSRFLSGLLYGVSPLDPATYLVVASALLLVALLAGFLPAKRASKVDPIRALKCE